MLRAYRAAVCTGTHKRVHKSIAAANFSAPIDELAMLGTAQAAARPDLRLAYSLNGR
jgi:hypothetical protein